MKPKLTSYLFAACFLLLLLLSTAVLSRAATNTVIVGPGGLNTFSPGTVFINVGDTVVWTNASGTHNAVCQSANTNICGSQASLSSTRWTYSYKFTVPGTNRYQCTAHASNFTSGMTNRVIVNNPPSISITNPVNGTLFASPATFQIQATATDTGGSITNVQFFRNFVSIGNKTTAPFNFTVSSLPAGNYIFTAQARDNSGATTTSSAITVSVITNASIASSKLTNANFQLSINAVTGLTYVVQASTNLASTNWISLGTNIATNTPFSFIDTNASKFTNRFYRIRSQ